jgi:hypothetical protein
LTLFASDQFTYEYNTNLLGSQGFSTGRQEGWSNNVTAGLTWHVTRSDSLNLSVGYDLFRFGGNGDGVDSDTYSVQAGVTHDFSPRFSSYLNYAFSYIDAREQDSSMTHSPTLGLSYQFTRDITGRVSGGAGITTGLDGGVNVSPVISASLEKTFKAGAVSATYSRGVEIASGFGGPTDSQTISGSLVLTALARGTLVVFTPSYRIAQSVSSQQVGQIDVRAITLTLAATYQLFQYVSIFADYQFFQQRTGGSSTSQRDVDQNRVRVGLQFGYPISFD